MSISPFSDFGKSFNKWILSVLTAAMGCQPKLVEYNEDVGSLLLKYTLPTPVSDISAYVEEIRKELERKKEVFEGMLHIELSDHFASIMVMTMMFEGRIISSSIDIYRDSNEVSVSVIKFQ